MSLYPVQKTYPQLDGDARAADDDAFERLRWVIRPLENLYDGKRCRHGHLCPRVSFPFLLTRRETYGRCGLGALYEWLLERKIQRA